MLRGLSDDLMAEPQGQTVQTFAVGVAVLDLLFGRVEELQKRPRSLGADFGHEPLVTLVARLDPEVVVLVLIEEVLKLDLLLSGLRDHVRRVIDDLFEVAQRHAEQVSELAGERLEEPDVCDRHGEFDMPHALAPDLGKRHFDAAAVADMTAEADALELPAVTLPVLYRPEDTRTEEAVAFGLERSVIDRFRLDHFAERPAADVFR